MQSRAKKISILSITISALFLVSVSSTSIANAESVPDWVKNNALWYGQGIVSESEFLNAIKFLIENEVIVIEEQTKSVTEITDTVVTIPNGNADVSSSGFYIPLNMEIPVGTTVTWVNEDSFPHNVQSQDEFGKVSDVFNSPPLDTGERFEFTFEEEGVYNYFCSFHPWRVGLITVK